MFISGQLGILAETKEAVFDYLLNTRILVVAPAIGLLPLILQRLPISKEWMTNQWVVRLLPVVQLLLSIIAPILPGALSLPDTRSGTIVIASIWVAGLSLILTKFVDVVILGDDPRIKTLAVESIGQYQAAMTKDPSKNQEPPKESN